MNGQNRAAIKIGASVNVVLKADQRSGKLTKGVVAKLLTKSASHPHGIKVMLEDGQVGRVQEVFNKELETMSMINIRTEQPADYRKVEEIARKAFWNLYLPGASEHYLIHTMRSHHDYMPELSFVILEDGEIIGSIHFTRAWIVTPSGEEIPVVHFGPVCITPELHRQGYGRAIITHAIEKAKALGHRAIVLGGFRYHYEPYGFAPTKKYNITMPDGLFYTGIMALPLYDGALNGITGKIKFTDGLYPDESGLPAYDATFPYAEKVELPCQKAFEQAAAELDENEYK